MLQNGGIFLLPGRGRYSVAASIAGDSDSTVCGEFAQDATGGVLTVRTAAEHLSTIIHLQTLLTTLMLETPEGLEGYEEFEVVAAAAHFGVELHQLMLLLEHLSLDIDEEVYVQVRGDVWRALHILHQSLTHLQQLHDLGHAKAAPYLPEYFAFIAAHPLPDPATLEGAAEGS